MTYLVRIVKTLFASAASNNVLARSVAGIPHTAIHRCETPAAYFERYSLQASTQLPRNAEGNRMAQGKFYGTLNKKTTRGPLTYQPGNLKVFCPRASVK